VIRGPSPAFEHEPNPRSIAVENTNGAGEVVFYKPEAQAKGIQ
jgi:hypothetical protein